MITCQSHAQTLIHGRDPLQPSPPVEASPSKVRAESKAFPVHSKRYRRFITFDYQSCSTDVAYGPTVQCAVLTKCTALCNVRLPASYPPSTALAHEGSLRNTQLSGYLAAASSSDGPGMIAPRPGGGSRTHSLAKSKSTAAARSSTLESSRCSESFVNPEGAVQDSDSEVRLERSVQVQVAAQVASL
eukprot:1042610-Rhodomonas_salina.1